jgi:hypothetical protein
MPPFEVKWTAPEFEFREKTVSWYWLTIIIAIVMLGVAVWQKNFLFGFFIVVAEILVLAWANRKPRNVEFILNERGLSVSGQKFHEYAELQNFSASTNPDEEWPSLSFQFKRNLKTNLKIKVPKGRAAEIQKILRTILPQVEYQKSLLDALEEFLGF